MQVLPPAELSAGLVTPDEQQVERHRNGKCPDQAGIFRLLQAQRPFLYVRGRHSY